VDRQVSKRVDRHHRPDRPLAHVNKGHRGERVDLAVEGELAPPGHDHHQDLHLVVAVRVDAIAETEPDQVGLQVLSVQLPQGAWPVPGRREGDQVDRRNGVAHPTMLSSHTRWSQRITAATRSALLRQALPFLGGDPGDQAGAARVAGAEDRGLALCDRESRRSLEVEAVGDKHHIPVRLVPEGSRSRRPRHDFRR
jgi:hypothetical protein